VDTNETPWAERWKLIIRGGVSIAVLGAGLYIILSSQYPDSTSKWAYGVIGVVLGYWLR